MERFFRVNSCQLRLIVDFIVKGIKSSYEEGYFTICLSQDQSKDQLVEVIPTPERKKPRRVCRAFCGTSWNRTSDTRIFSPLLYQLSYGTILKWGANIIDLCQLRQAFFIVRLLLDFGNTRAKAALFDKEEIVWVKTILASEESEWKEIFLREDIQAAMISASGDIPKVWNQFFQRTRFPVHFLKSDDPLPFINAYTTPSTLGLDRLANVAAAQVFCPNRRTGQSNVE